MTYLKPLFNIERVHVNGSKLYYQLSYKVDNVYNTLVDACFLTLKDAELYIESLLD